MPVLQTFVAVLLLCATLPVIYSKVISDTSGLTLQDDWSYAVANGKQVNFFFRDADTPPVHFNLTEPKNTARKRCLRVSSTRGAGNCKLHQWWAQNLEHMAIGMGIGSKPPDLFVSTSTYSGSYSSIIHVSLTNDAQIQTIFSSRVSKINSLAYHNGLLFWTECDLALKGHASFNGIWFIDTTVSKSVWIATRLNGTEKLNTCKLQDMVIDYQKTSSAAGEFSFLWVDRALRGKPTVQRYSYHQSSSSGRIKDVRLPARNPHALTISGDNLYWGDNPSLMTFTVNKMPLSSSRESDVKTIYTGTKQRLRSLSVLCSHSDSENLVWVDSVTNKLWTYEGGSNILQHILVDEDPASVISRYSSGGTC